MREGKLWRELMFHQLVTFGMKCSPQENNADLAVKSSLWPVERERLLVLCIERLLRYIVILAVINSLLTVNTAPTDKKLDL